MTSDVQTEWDDTQIAILDGAIACIYKLGFQNLTTRCIADEAGINEVTIFRRFGNKASVLDAVFAREAKTVAALNIAYSGDLEADLTQIVTVLWQLIQKRQTIIPILLTELQRNPELNQPAQHSIEQVGQFIKIIQHYQQQGQLQQGNPMTLFAVLVGPMIFATLVGTLLPMMESDFDLQEFVRRFLFGYSKTS